CSIERMEIPAGPGRCVPPSPIGTCPCPISESFDCSMPGVLFPSVGAHIDSSSGSFSTLSVCSDRLSGSPFNPYCRVSVVAGSYPTISDVQERASLACDAPAPLPRCDCQKPNSNACG